MSEISPRHPGRGFCGFFIFPLLSARKHKVNKTPPKCPSHHSGMRCSATPSACRAWGKGRPPSQVRLSKWREAGTDVTPSPPLSGKASQAGVMGAGGCGKCLPLSVADRGWVARRMGRRMGGGMGDLRDGRGTCGPRSRALAAVGPGEAGCDQPHSAGW